MTRGGGRANSQTIIWSSVGSFGNSVNSVVTTGAKTVDASRLFSLWSC